MLKTILLTSVVSASLASAVVLAAGRLHYSGLQIQQPVGGAFKMAPDPSNIWSFHETVKITKDGFHEVPVVVDFDGNGKMDTEHKHVRILITDISVSRGSTLWSMRDVTLVDDKGERWVVPSIGLKTGRSFNAGMWEHVDHLRTPLALPVNSGLKVRFHAGYDSNTPNSPANEIRIHLIGRLVTL